MRAFSSTESYSIGVTAPQASVGSSLSSVVGSSESSSNLEQFVSPHFQTWNRASRSNSWSDPVPTADDAATDVAGRRGSNHAAVDVGERSTANWSELLDPDQAELYESLKMVYANVLMNWGLLTGQEKTMAGILSSAVIFLKEEMGRVKVCRVAF